VVLGVVAGLEEERASGGGPSAESVVAARGAMAGPLAALGEAFFWNTWLPVCLAAALAWAAARPEHLCWAPVIFLGLFNAAHLGVRALGLRLGYRWKSAVVSRLAFLRLQKVLPFLAVLGAVLALAAAALAPVAGGPATGVGVTVLFLGILRLGVRPFHLALATAGVSVALAALT
jgi:PTS system mannose-specific IID component